MPSSQKFFISFNSRDQQKAHWIAWTLREADHEVAVHDWELPAGGNAPDWMTRKLAWADRLIAVISPDAKLVGDVFVPPQDVGLVRQDGPVVLRVDAFNSHEWGVLTGRVTSISGDVLETSTGPIFRVRTTLDRDFLELSSGLRGNLRKGMSFEARFLVARRTLFQLLRDKVDDWVDPQGRGAS